MPVPTKTPKTIVDRLRQECSKVLALPAIQAKFKPQGINPMPMTPTQFDAFIRKEIDANLKLVKAAGLKFK